MRLIVLSLVLVFVFTCSSFAAVSAKGGLAGGAFRLSAAVDRPINDKVTLAGELGYGIGNNYSLVSAGVDVQTNIKNNIYIGAEVSYSSYSNPVTLGLPAVDINDKSGVGGGIYAGLTRDKMYAQAGYDTRMGAIAEAGYILRM